ncbi:hypothetical protein HMI54_012645 [Coelomomyces lativittatus]|nr:hypothetical protein HMI54_012645 [Coelomomyces lativittatus]KAJ1515659.1 hypothetical protein HMI56_002672 [Coelomomyces lativittatus]KAJ1518088.1 hypothetical protein HMI55_003146 [Coelomomyces lativittatus]
MERKMSLLSLSPPISPLPDFDSLTSSPSSHHLQAQTFSPSSEGKKEKVNHTTSADTTLSDLCLTNLEPISSPPVPVRSSPSTNGHLSKPASLLEDSEENLTPTHRLTPSPSTLSTNAIRVKRHRLVEIPHPSTQPLSSQGRTEPSVCNRDSSTCMSGNSIRASKMKSTIPCPISSEYLNSSAYDLKSSPPLFLTLSNDSDEDLLPSSLIHGHHPAMTGASAYSPSSSSPSLDSSFSSDLSDFSTIYSDLEDLDEDALIKALNQKLPPSALDMFISLKEKDNQQNFRNPSNSPKLPPLSPLSPRQSPLPSARNVSQPSSSPFLMHAPSLYATDIPLSPLSIMNVPQLNHLAKVYGLLLDVHCLHLNPVTLYTVPSATGGWLSMSTLCDYQSAIHFKLPNGLGSCTFFIPLRQPQRQRSELNTLRILCPQQETVPLQCNAKTIQILMTQPCHVTFNLEPKQKLVSGFKSSIQRNSKTILVKTESQVKVLPLLKSADFQYHCEVPFFMENTKFLGYLDMTIKLLPILRASEEIDKESPVSSTLHTINETNLKNIENEFGETMNESHEHSCIHSKQMLSHPALAVPFELNVSISNFIPIVLPNVSKWPLGVSFPTDPDTKSTVTPTLTLSLKCSVTLNSSPISCVWSKLLPNQRCYVDLNTLFSLPITLRQLTPWLQVPLILEVYYHISSSTCLLGLVKLPLGHLLETFLLSEKEWTSMVPLSMQSECPVVDPISDIVQGYICVALQLEQHLTPNKVDSPLSTPSKPSTDYLPLAIRVQGTGGFLGLANKAIKRETTLPMLYKVQLDLFPDSLSSLVSNVTLHTPWKRGLPQYQFQHTLQLRALEPMLLKYLEQGIASGQVFCASESTQVIGQFEVPLHFLLRRSSGITGWIPVQSIEDDVFGCLQLEMMFKNTEKKAVSSCATEWVDIVLYFEDIPEHSFSLDASVFGFMQVSLTKKENAYIWGNGLDVNSETLVKILNGNMLVHVQHMASNFKGICFIDTFDLAQTIRSGSPARLRFRKEVVRPHDPETSSLYLTGYLQIEPAESKPQKASILKNSNFHPLCRHDSKVMSSSVTESSDELMSSRSPASTSSHSVESPIPSTYGKLVLCFQMLRFQRKEQEVSLPIQFSVPWDDDKVMHTTSGPSHPFQATLSLPLKDTSSLHDRALTIYLHSTSFGQAQVQLDISMLAKGWPKICGWYHLYHTSEQGKRQILGQVLLEIHCTPPVSNFLNDTPTVPNKSYLPITVWTPPKSPYPRPNSAFISRHSVASVTSSPSSLSSSNSKNDSTILSDEEELKTTLWEEPNLCKKKNPSAFVSVHSLRQRAAAIEREIQMTLRQYAFMDSLDVS